jgi:hypothetical protein
MLIYTERKLLYIGEASNLIERLRQDHPSIPKWNFFRYNVLPNEIAPHRITFERMVICDFASFLTMRSGAKAISECKIVNDRIDSV